MIPRTKDGLKKLFDRQYKAEEPYIFVDTSYVIYYAMSSAWKAYSSEFDIEDDPQYDPIVSKEFRAILEKKIKNCLYYPVHSIYPTFSFNKTIFALDCPKTELWRNDVYPEYKLQRKIKDHSKDKFLSKNVFKYVEDNILPSFCEQNPGAKIIRVPHAEGDDIIAVLVKQIDKKEKKVIIASDHDYCQLLEDENLKIINCQCSEITLLGESQKKVLQDAERVLNFKDVLLYKILRGDVADNIKPIFRGCGEAKACNYILDKKALKEKLDSDKLIKHQFSLNRKLVDFNYIPDSIREMILEEYNGQ